MKSHWKKVLLKSARPPLRMIPFLQKRDVKRPAQEAYPWLTIHDEPTVLRLYLQYLSGGLMTSGIFRLMRGH